MKKRAFAILVTMVLFFTACSSDGKEPPVQDHSDSQGSLSDKAVGFSGDISGDFFDISIVGAKWTDNLETSIGTFTPENEGSKLLCLIFSAKNTTDETKNLGLFSAYVDKKATLPTVVAGGIDDAMVFVGAVAGGMEMKAYQVWELPEDWKEFQLNYFEATGPECKQFFVIHQEDIGIE